MCIKQQTAYNLQKASNLKENNLPQNGNEIHFDKAHAFVNHKQTSYKTLFLLIPCRHVQFSLPVSLSKRPGHQISALGCQV